jgi:ABC-2 type transport system permease protein
MAEVKAAEAAEAGRQPIPASTQLLAVAWLRWRIFVNNTFRKRPRTGRQAVGLAFRILVRLIVWPILALMVVGPVTFSSFYAWAAIAHHHQERLQTLLAAITLLWQFISINGLSIAATVSNFDASSLTRFPLRFGRYLVLRTMIGIMTPSTVVGCLTLLAAAAGISIARPALALPALIVLAVYALMNVFLTRMIGAWMERWLANRRFREIFGVLMALSAVSVQVLNYQRFSSHHGVQKSWLVALMQSSGSSVHWLPPGFAAYAIIYASHPIQALMWFAGLVASTALFAWVFAIRLRKQFLGEYLSEGAAPRSRQGAASRARGATQEPARPEAVEPEIRPAGFPPILGACLRKEWLTFRGNSAQLIGLITPLIFIVILNRGLFAMHPTYYLPGAIAYVMLGMLASLYNVFGADGLGVQVYLLAPVRMRDVIVAKNLASLALILVETGLAWVLVSVLERTPIPFSTEASTFFWLVFVIALNLALGTLRSIQAPRKFNPAQTRRQRSTPTDRTSGLLMILVLFGSLMLQVPVGFLSHHLDLPWLGVWVFGPLAVAGVAVYVALLRNAERLILAHRDVFAEELCKA